MPDSPHTADIRRCPFLVEAAKGLLDRASGSYLARNGKRVSIQADDGEKCWIVHSDDIEDLRRAVATLQGSATTLPSEAMTEEQLREHVARALSVPQHHTTWDTLTWQEKDLFYMQADYAIAAMRAATPVQDDDAELIARMAGAIGEALDLSPELKIDMQHSGNFAEAAAAALKEARLSPTPDTGLIEALELRNAAREAEIEACLARIAELEAALANASPAQVESDDAAVRDALETARQRAVVLFQAYARGVQSKDGRTEEQFIHDVSTFNDELTDALRHPISIFASRHNQATKGDGL